MSSSRTRRARPYSSWTSILIGLALFLLVAVAWNTHACIRRLSDDQVAVERSHEALGALDHCFAEVKDVQAARRGYVITRQVGFLESFRARLPFARAALEGLRDLTTSHPEMATGIAALVPLCERVLLDLERSVDGQDAATLSEEDQLRHTEAGDALTERIRQAYSAQSAEIQAELRRRKRDSAASVRTTGWALATGTAVSLALFGIAAVALMREVATRRRIQAELRESNAVMQNALEGFSRLDPAGRYLHVNAAYARTLGYSPDELIGREWPITVHPDDRASVEEAYRIMLRDGKGEADARGVRKDGTLFYKHVVLIQPPEGTDASPGHFCFMKDVSDRRRAAEQLSVVNQALETKVSELSQRSREMELLSQMGEMLQACAAAREAHRVVAQFGSRLLPAASGALFVLNASRNLLERVATWGDEGPDEPMFAPEDCWALRSGRPHFTADPRRDVSCPHVRTPSEHSMLCLPLSAQTDLLGVLHLRCGDSAGAEACEGGTRMESNRRVAFALAEQVGLALANLRLRDTLRNQAIRDPLTGLFNRRYMEESLARELHRATRKGTPVCVAMLDLDHFKGFNDRFGHEAGDFLLAQFGDFLRASIRADDVACRYGGEEMALILPEVGLDAGVLRVDALRAGLQHLPFEHSGRALGPVTVSAGVAAFPAHGTAPAVLLRAADAALYSAKAGGRNRVERAPAPIPDAEPGGRPA